MEGEWVNLIHITILSTTVDKNPFLGRNRVALIVTKRV